ncbi:MAG: hypothetical protein C0404_02460 [Verrucomicrobia bacterium]|nr:hypothetical protein [Verrucomicrobiota bacterium]
MKTTKILIVVLGAACLGALPLHAAGEVGKAIEVAPKVENTKCQMWPRMAWSEGAKCWLIAWREGFPNQNEANIVCARVSADGQVLDPAGIVVCKAKANQEYPTVASDGKGFLVAWEDLRNGKAWSVYAARVAGDGKVLDQDGFLVAGGDEYNRGRPAAAYVDGSYLLVWQGYVYEPTKLNAERHGDLTIDGTYNLFAGRVSSEGKVLNVSPEPIIRDKMKPMIDPSVSAAGKTAVVAFRGGGEDNFWNEGFVGVVRVDPASGKSAGGVNFSEPLSPEDKPFCPSGGRMPGLLMIDEKSGLHVHKPKGRLSGNLMTLRKCGQFGNTSDLLGTKGAGGLNIIPSLSWDGNQVLLVMDWNMTPDDGNQVAGDPRWKMETEIRGWVIAADGKLQDDPKTGFVISAEGPHKVEMQGVCAAGPKGTFLVAYVQLRSVADTKLMARVVKIK